MLASNNVLSPPTASRSSCRPRISCWACTTRPARDQRQGRGHGPFADVGEVKRAWSRSGGLHAKVIVRLTNGTSADGDHREDHRHETTVGRAILSEILPKGLPFSVHAEAAEKKEISRLINFPSAVLACEGDRDFADKLMQPGFGLATRGGISICVMTCWCRTQVKQDLMARCRAGSQGDRPAVHLGLVTDGERYNKVVDIWGRAGDQVAKAMMDQLGRKTGCRSPKATVKQESFNAILHDGRLGARGSAAQIRQLAGMRGLMAKPDGSIIETPITTNFREGLNVLQYFISTTARKGLADTALKTANSVT